MELKKDGVTITVNYPLDVARYKKIGYKVVPPPVRDEEQHKDSIAKEKAKNKE